MSTLSIPKESLPDLEHLTNILHLFNHRNKNQHRRSIWFRSFSLFRRQLHQLTSDVAQYYTEPTTNLARTRKKSQDVNTIAKTDARLVFWRDVMIPKWQHAFSQLIADGRFSVLGLVLLAVLAEVCKVVGMTEMLQELEQREVVKVLEAFGREEWGGGKGNGMEDLGEVIDRVMEADVAPAREEEPPKAMEISSPAAKPESVATPIKVRKSEVSGNAVKKKKKRKRKGDEIDDIFG